MNTISQDHLDDRLEAELQSDMKSIMDLDVDLDKVARIQCVVLSGIRNELIKITEALRSKG